MQLLSQVFNRKTALIQPIAFQLSIYENFSLGFVVIS